MMTRACRGSFTEGSRGRTRPFSTMPTTATGWRRLRGKWDSIGEMGASRGIWSGAMCGSAAICSSFARRSGCGCQVQLWALRAILSINRR